MDKEKRGITPIQLLEILLTVTFVVLKLCKVIDWSWWWVLSPVWIPTILILIWVLIICVCER